LPVVDEVSKTLDPLDFRHRLCSSAITGLLWVVITHDLQNRPAFLADLKTHADFLDAWKNASVGRYLINIQTDQFCSN